jgi:hypothetical protein
MSITIENAGAEALLAELAEMTRRIPPDLLLDLLRRERERISGEAERRIAEGLAADEAKRRRLAESALDDPHPIDEILARDEHGLPA